MRHTWYDKSKNLARLFSQMYIGRLKFKVEKNEGNLFYHYRKGRGDSTAQYLPPIEQQSIKKSTPWILHAAIWHIHKAVKTAEYQTAGSGYQLITNIWPLLIEAETRVLGEVHQRNNFIFNERREGILWHPIYPTTE